MNKNRMDYKMECCLTCVYWGGWREFDGIGTFTFDMDNKEGRCNQVHWKGFGGATMNYLNKCTDGYEPMYK